MSQYGVVLVPNTSSALKAEQLLRRAGYTEQLIPTPREFSSDCGLAVRINWSQRDEVRQLLADGKVEIVDIHKLDRSQLTK
ncbi:MAG: DUF3343 domain-containing protein [Chloroflexi bacterium]|nr:DUF3343 domain-containing protein [Chloroflexota bacterium]